MKKLLLAFTFLFATHAFALVYEMPTPGNDVIGQVEIIAAEKGDTLYKLGRINELGKDEMLHANPHLKEYGRIKPDTEVILPTQFILPNTPHEGITINLGEKRLYFYPKHTNIVITEPIAIGRTGWTTPTIETHIVQKIKNPEWVAPDSIIKYSANKGIHLPKVAKPGPHNPLGHFALRLGNWVVLIHGTNDPLKIGKRVSSGCIRMFPEDIAQLYEKVDKNTPVYVIDEPFKIGWQHHYLYLEVHKPMHERKETHRTMKDQIYTLIKRTADGNEQMINWAAVDKTIEQRSGIPSLISF